MKRLLLILSLFAIIVPASGQTQTIKNRNTAVRRSTTTTTNSNTGTRPSTSVNTASPSSSTTTQTNNSDKARRDEINKYFADNASKDNAKALTINITEETLPPYIQVGTKALVLETEDVKVNQQNDQIFAANYENIYPGAIVFADANLANGDPTLAFDGGTVDLRVNFNSGTKSRTNVKNTAASVYDEIGSILNEAQYAPSPTAQYKSYYLNSAA